MVKLRQKNRVSNDTDNDDLEWYFDCGQTFNAIYFLKACANCGTIIVSENLF